MLSRGESRSRSSASKVYSIQHRKRNFECAIIDGYLTNTSKRSVLCRGPCSAVMTHPASNVIPLSLNTCRRTAGNVRMWPGMVTVSRWIWNRIQLRIWSERRSCDEERPRGPMDKASAYEAGDCGFESRRRLSLTGRSLLSDRSLTPKKMDSVSNTVVGRSKRQAHGTPSDTSLHCTQRTARMVGKMQQSNSFDASL